MGGGLPAGSLEYALGVLFAVRFYAVLRAGEALRFLIFALISLLALQGDYRALVWALVFDAIMVAAERVLTMLR